MIYQNTPVPFIILTSVDFRKAKIRVSISQIVTYRSIKFTDGDGYYTYLQYTSPQMNDNKVRETPEEIDELIQAYFDACKNC